MFVMLSLVLAAAPIKLAASEWCSAGLDPVLASTLEGRFFDLLHANGLDVTSPKDVSAVLGLERQKQLMGCSGEASCLAELGGALGVDGILYGCVVKAGSGFTATLRAISTKSAQPISSFSERLKNEDALQDWLDAKAKAMAEEIKAAMGATGSGITMPLAVAGSTSLSLAAQPPDRRDLSFEHPMAGLGIASFLVAGLGAGGAVLGFLQASASSRSLDAELQAQRQVTPEAQRFAQQGQLMEGLMWGGVAAAVVFAAAGIWSVSQTTGLPVRPSLSFGPRGTAFTVEVSLK